MKRKIQQRGPLHITESAAIAALYMVLTFISNSFGLASGAIQVRLSEMLTVLPMFTFSAVPGLFIGCLISNLLCSNALIDVIFGSVATLIGALGTYFLGKNKWLGVAFPIISNTVIVPFVLKYAYGLENGILFLVLTVGIGEVISCGILGFLLIKGLKKHKR